MLVFFFSILGLYLLAALLIGRQATFNDLLPRRAPNPARFHGYALEEVAFVAEDGKTLRGWFIPGKHNDDGRALVVLHGWLRNRAAPRAAIQLYLEAGYHVLTYDQRAHGASDTGMITFGPAEARDLRAALAYLRRRSEVDPDRIGIAAFSLGTSAVFHAFAHGRPPQVGAVVMEGIFASSYTVGKSTLEHRLGLGHAGALILGTAFLTVGAALVTLGRFKHGHPLQHAGEVAPNAPLLIVRGSRDEMVPAADAEAVIAAAVPLDVWRIEGGGHTDAARRLPEAYRARVIGFFDRHL